jgi:hypothetical protein
MGVTTKIPEKSTYREWEEGFTKFKAVGYEVGIETSLGDVNLENGDLFSMDTDYEIIGSEEGTTKNGHRMITVTAFKEVTV